MISIREEITIASPPDAVWPFLSDPAVVASCIPGATLTKAGANGTYQGTMRVKFGPTVAQFRGEARLTYDHAARRCSIEGRGIDGRGASRANASGAVEASGTDTTVLKVEGNFNVTGPLETFANAGGVHVARAILAEFAENVARLMAEQTIGATGKQAPFAEAAATTPPPEALALQAERRTAEPAATASRSAAAELRSREFAAWIGLVPSQNSSGGKERLGRISKKGNIYLRSLLVIGATALLRSDYRNKPDGAWLASLLRRKCARVATVALANKMARVAWAVLVKGETYRPRAANDDASTAVSAVVRAA